MNSVVHFEIPADDMNRAETFYSKVFNCEIQAMPEMNYTIVRTAPSDPQTHMLKEPGAINGGMMQRTERVTGPVITLRVKDIKQACEDVKKAGGDVVTEPWSIGEMGFAAYFKDTEGNVLGLWQDKPQPVAP